MSKGRGMSDVNEVLFKKQSSKVAKNYLLVFM